MSIHVAIHHRTQYRYDRLVALGPQIVRLRPAPHSKTRVLSYSLRVTPRKHFINWQQDPQSNYLARLVFPERTREFRVDVEIVVEMAVLNPFDFFLEPQAERLPFRYDPQVTNELMPFQLRLPRTGLFDEYLRSLETEFFSGNNEVAGADDEARPRTVDFLVRLNQRIWKDIQYIVRLEPGVQTPEETLRLRKGSCRDSAWLLVQVLRNFGLAARFVSGYLIQLKPDVRPLDGPAGAASDFSDLHAWCEVYLPGAGWVGLDPTSGLLAGEGHLPLAATPDPQSAAPISGLVDECECDFSFDIQVSRIYESARVTLPYTEEQWSRIDSLGAAIDRDLEQGDVRLTMGGEPTFVSIDNPDGPEWNFTAVSEEKRRLSAILLRRLSDRFASGALLHYGQGKWYPGESLPRWALAAYWRKDGVPVWNQPNLIADESKDYGHGAKEAQLLCRKIAETLGASPAHILPGYEDVFYYTWKERRLPSNVTPETSNLKDPLERERLARLFQKGLGEVVGYLLPLRRFKQGARMEWRSGPWFLRDPKTVWLLPGDSPMGLRLPLDSIPWVAEGEYPWLMPPDPMAPPPPLPIPARQRFVPGQPAPAPALTQSRRAQQLADSATRKAATEGVSPDTDDPARRPELLESAPWVIRTALCVEPRHGRLHVFIPPVETTEDYLDLIAAIEEAATETGFPVIIEGSTPPPDPRLNKLAVTPDPGVIEVNLHPARSWADLVHNTTVLYEEARLTRLATEKFLIDGRQSGTGGGNHILIGGETPADSPILRRPDLLRSLLSYWHNHPSLSRIFSGMFIGPTSQAPRVDEARNDSVHELELAFAQVPSPAGQTPPWLVDRLFRNLLIDASGNTHRAEFSIDKLYSPEGSTGRLGLVEMRAFEMPPHPRMSLVQHLLLRALIARFWKKPYTRPLVRWGTDLFDRWLLPHYCERDLREVIADLRESGYPLEFEWFQPHLEFRFPQIGTFAQRDIEIELRSALEPWHVLGEEAGYAGTVRYVDSSLERLQVKARGLISDRFCVTCNGRRVPLRSTGVPGEAVAAVRYRAWQPANCLQPTIGVHAPLVIDLHDTWNERSLGGCTYHVAHPGGRNYSTLPVNAFEAESRRRARFQPHGATQGRFVPQSEMPNPDFPLTLDLRWPARTTSEEQRVP